MKWLWILTSLSSLTSLAFAQQSSIPQMYFTDVLRARLVAVVPYSQSQAIDDPGANQRARLDTEQALLRWGKYQITGDPTLADLIVVVRPGRARSTTVNSGGPPGTILYPNDTGVTIGTHRGQTPPLSRTDPSPGQPRVGGEVGSVDDRLEVYLGGTQNFGDASRNKNSYPLDEAPIWSYTAPDGLKPPTIEAVVKFRQAVEAAQKKHP